MLYQREQAIDLVDAVLPALLRRYQHGGSWCWRPTRASTPRRARPCAAVTLLTLPHAVRTRCLVAPSVVRQPVQMQRASAGLARGIAS